ncbi:MAG TPA: hypothetical protein DIS66_00125 [Candidatus Omnitrophica bacterium]|nr:hypothetical protein [Candidatus Omnitrophota bacterium]
MFKKSLIWMLFAFVFMTPGWCAETDLTAPPSASTNSPTAQRMLRSGDVLNITVWQHKDLTTTVIVDEESNVEYLFLGVISVKNKTVHDLKEILRKGISENYIVDPKIDITVDRRSLTFFIAGEIAKPGTYEFRPGITVLEAVAMAGGFTDYASRKVKIVRRGDDGAEREIKINTKKLLRATDQREDSRIYVDDILVADRAWL